NNNNLYFNGSYKGFYSNDWSLQTGASYTRATNNMKIIEDDVDNSEHSFHVKAKIKKLFSNRFSINFGTEYFLTDFNEDYSAESGFTDNAGFKNHLGAAYAEGDIFFSKNFAAKVGVRGEFSELLEEFTVSPRLSVAYKTSEKGQISLAYGDFYQNPNTNFLKYASNFKSEKASHYILNYQLNKDGQTFRAEAYYKGYNNLIKYDTELAQFDSDYNYNNSGYGHAAGLDIFWRDNKNIKNIDYWLSYSYLNTER